MPGRAEDQVVSAGEAHDSELTNDPFPLLKPNHFQNQADT